MNQTKTRMGYKKEKLGKWKENMGRPKREGKMPRELRGPYHLVGNIDMSKSTCWILPANSY